MLKYVNAQYNLKSYKPFCISYNFISSKKSFFVSSISFNLNSWIMFSSVVFIFNIIVYFFVSPLYY